MTLTTNRFRASHLCFGALLGAASLLAPSGCLPVDDTGTGGSGGEGGSTSSGPQAISVRQAAKEIPPGGKYHMPLDSPDASVSLFSESRELFFITNESDSKVTLDDVVLSEHDGVMDEEFALQEGVSEEKPLAAKGLVLDPGAELALYVKFYPVAHAERGATLSITYDGGKKYEITITGKGLEKGVFFSHGETALQKLLGGKGSDELAGGMVADAQGNAYITANVSGLIDKFADDLLVARMNADGSLAWAKIYSGPHRDGSPDPGQNGESGGAARSIAIGKDGDVYVAGTTSLNAANSSLTSLVLKIGAADGSLKWAKTWGPSAEVLLAKDVSTAYGLDASGDSVLVTGSEGSGGVFLVSLDPANGSLRYQRRVDAAAAKVDRGYAARSDGKGNAYVSGLTDGRGLLFRVTGAHSMSPSLAWTKRIDLGTGSNLNDLDVDADGNVYAALDIRGATTTLAAGSFDPAGAVRWAKAYSGSTNDRNNTHSILVSGGDVYFAGRVGPGSFDTGLGDGFVAKLGTADGGLGWAAFYYTGIGWDELSQHRVKSVALAGSRLLLGVQAYTGPDNGLRYHGYWYDGVGELTDLDVLPADIATAMLEDLPNGTVKDAPAEASWVDAPSTVVYQDATDKHDGESPDADVMLMAIDLK